MEADAAQVRLLDLDGWERIVWIAAVEEVAIGVDHLRRDVVDRNRQSVEYIGRFLVALVTGIFLRLLASPFGLRLEYSLRCARIETSFSSCVPLNISPARDRGKSCLDQLTRGRRVRKEYIYRRLLVTTAPRIEPATKLPSVVSRKPFEPTATAIARCGSGAGTGFALIQSRYCVVASI